MRYLILISCLLGLAACGEQIQERNIGYIAAPIVESCPSLPRLPETNLTMAQVEIYWRQDRLLYLECRSEKDELLRILAERNITYDILQNSNP